tara:strand:- start:13774 stop:14808 length:1035 start_codon:yes stop_codon:yes gene_type:complete
LILLSLTSIVTCTFASNNSIGTVTEHTGSGIIQRESNNYDANVSDPVQMDDEVKTAKGVVGITFNDDTQVHVGQHSELYIDDFVYDPESSSGSLGLLVTMGTVKYASGNIAHNNPDTVDIQTPSATIAVRGTAFSMTVNEIGDSLIILLPNSDGTVGEISVATDMGIVILNKAFQLTSVYNRDAVPSKPVVVLMDEDMINNLMIISPPAEVKKDLMEAQVNDALDIDLLAFEGLENEFDKAEDELEFNELDINELNVDLLSNMLRSAFSDVRDGKDPGLNEDTGVYTFINIPSGRVVRYSNNAVIDIKYQLQPGMNIELRQPDGEIYIQTLEEESSNTIVIKQQ